MSERKRIGLAYAGLAAAALFWAGNAVVARGTVGLIPPLAMSFWRWVIALLILLPFALPHLLREWPVVVSRWRHLVGLSILSVGTYNTLLYLAAQTTTAVNITLISATMPVMIALMARLLLGSRLQWLQWAGILLALVGVAVIVFLGAAPGTATINQGDLIIIAAVLTWGLYSVLLRWRPLPLHQLTVLLVLVVVGLPCILPFYLWELSVRGGMALTGDIGLTLFYIGLFPSVLAYLFWNYGVSSVGPSRAGMFIYLVPIFTAVVAWFMLGERLQGRHALGAVLILVGLFFSTRSGSVSRS